LDNRCSQVPGDATADQAGGGLYSLAAAGSADGESGSRGRCARSIVHRGHRSWPKISGVPMQAHTVARGPSPHSNQPSNYPTEQPRGQPAPRQLPPHELRQGPLCVTTAVVPHNRPATAGEGGHPAQPPTTEQRETRGRLASKGARHTKPQTQTRLQTATALAPQPKT
jgi:hypothetical protein